MRYVNEYHIQTVIDTTSRMLMRVTDRKTDRSVYGTDTDYEYLVNFLICELNKEEPHQPITAG